MCAHELRDIVRRCRTFQSLHHTHRPLVSCRFPHYASINHIRDVDDTIKYELSYAEHHHYQDRQAEAGFEVVEEQINRFRQQIGGHSYSRVRLALTLRFYAQIETAGRWSEEHHRVSRFARNSNIRIYPEILGILCI